LRKLETEFEINTFSTIDNEESIWENEKEKQKYFTNLASEIGWIIIEFSSLENKLETSLLVLLNSKPILDEIIAVEISIKTYRQKVELFNKTVLAFVNAILDKSNVSNEFFFKDLIN